MPTIVGGHLQRHILPSWGLTKSTPSLPSNKTLFNCEIPRLQKALYSGPLPRARGSKVGEVKLI